MSTTHRPRRRARWFVAAAVLVVVLGTTSAVVLTRVSSASQPQAAPPPQVQTTPVVRTDLSDQDEADGTLGYGDETPVDGRKPGTITALPTAGSTIIRGKPVYDVDAKHVPLFYGTLPFYRDLANGSTDGPDVKELEQNLKALGFGGFGTPDDKFTSATANAVKKWQKSLGLEQTGTFGQGDVVLAPDQIRVSTVSGRLGAPASGEVAKSTGTKKLVQVQLEAAKQNLARIGAKVTVSINGQSTKGTVTAVGTTAKDGKDPNGQDDGKPKITVTITLDDQSVGGSLDAAPASVEFTRDVHRGVLAVPVGALVALAEGGYAVEVDEGGKRRLIAVTTGLFSGGNVEVSGPGLKEGMRVVTTS